MTHDLTLDGPLVHPGGKNGMFQVKCSCGEYVSPPGGHKNSKLMWVAARQHKNAKEAREAQHDEGPVLTDG